jgi:chromosome segregation protein
LQFSRLRLAGFKSFVDPVDLEIAPGLTGVVGPNGCGKSNLVEALRWVMGENSARRMRGGEMEDVIFGGTATRPARNIAEVTLVIENDGVLPPGIVRLAGSGDIEISRRIERGQGSDYRVSGRPARARDVQTFFADAASGSQSPALVSQGRVSALINAKPTERRQVLEDAAGISGLHARRHEAELKLRAAETNLERLDDVVGAMQAQLTGLKRQVRQAVRYRELSEELRRADAVLLALAWRTLIRREADARAAFAAADGLVRQAMLDVAQATTRSADCAASLPPLRKEEAERIEALSRVIARRDTLAAEERRIGAATEEATRQSRQLAADRAHEARQQGDADLVEARLAAEAAALAQQAEGHPARRHAAETDLSDIRAAVAAAEKDLNLLTEEVAKAEAEAVALGRQKRDVEQRLITLDRRLAEERRRRDSMPADDADIAAIAAAASRLAEAERAEARERENLAAVEAARSGAETAVGAARSAERQASGEANRLVAERKGLAGLLKSGGGAGGYPTVLDAVRAARGYETALAAALADGLEAALDPAAALHWRAASPAPAPASWPEGVEPLAPRITAPPQLAHALAYVGLAADDRSGDRLAPLLAPGQVLVSRAGGVWRWDGLVRRPGAASPAAARLEQRNRLEQVERELAEADRLARLAAENLAQADKALAAHAAADKLARAAVMAAAAALERARGDHLQRRRDAEARSIARQSLAQSVAVAEADREAAAADLAALQSGLAALPDATLARRRLEQLRTQVSADRNRQAGCQSAIERLGREESARNQRLAAIASERQEWRDRAARAAARVLDLDARAEAVRATLESLAAEPARLAAERQTVLSDLALAEKARRVSADAVAAAESAQQASDRLLRQVEAAMAEARETRIRAEAAVSAAIEELQQLRVRAAERLGDAAPHTIDLRILSNLAGLEADRLPEPAAAEARHAKLLRDREAIGPVNLRAEIEAAELEAEIARMTAERDDLLAAIARLRQAVHGLNREARERLLASFGAIDAHFRQLFTQLFGGGSAELKLTEAEDPLDAGLEILASPPGKKLQHLSLLSGGEQALTAIALIFAMFLTNPSPVCVLDEVDAPLDDANVDRFCLLVQKIAESVGTRFLIITHHRLTMARMDRLYGVTMAERGVSQLVSVDLKRADALSAAE